MDFQYAIELLQDEIVYRIGRITIIQNDYSITDDTKKQHISSDQKIIDELSEVIEFLNLETE